MSFKDIKLKYFYDSDEDDILNDFYIPVLSESTLYKRAAGYFSSYSFALAARGMANFISNEGIMHLLINVAISKEDAEAIELAIKEPDVILTNLLLKDLKEIEDEFTKNHLKALAWMVAKKQLEIKVALVEKSRVPSAIFHQKIGILTDKENNTISFSGSDNESASGWTENIEQFKVFCSWKADHKPFLQADIETFEKFWLQKAKRTRVIDFPQALKEELLKIVPRTPEEYAIVRKYLSKSITESEEKEKIDLRDYQKTVIKNWFKQSTKGILKMATGTGKTIIALYATNELFDKKKKLAIVIMCPYKSLVDQWRDETSKHLHGFNPIIAYESKGKWENEVNRQIKEYNLGVRKKLCIIVTNATFTTLYFQSLIRNIKSDFLIIADEVHHLGSEIGSDSLPNNAQFRLGLSATPTRSRDPEGTEAITKYFGEIIPKPVGLKFAIDNGFLNDYYYKPEILELSDDEMEEYIKISKEISKKWHIFKDPKKRDEMLTPLYTKRANILNKAAAKMGSLSELIDQTKNDLAHTIIYCADMEQLESVSKLLFDKGIRVGRITNRESDAQQRKNTLENFKKGTLEVLIAINCLDEGIDISAIKTAFILASTTNPRQFIQRRGRLLRILRDDKGRKIRKRVKIYDLITAPPQLQTLEDGKEIIEAERNILRREMERFKEFSELAANEFEAREQVKTLLKRFDIAI